MDASGQPTAAWRRRQRRLRSMLRHERQTVAMELTAALHHSRGGGPETHEGLQAQQTASAGPAEYFDLNSDDGRPAGGVRPAALEEPRPQEGTRRHTGEVYELVLDPVVPQLDRAIPEQPDALLHRFLAAYELVGRELGLDRSLSIRDAVSQAVREQAAEHEVRECEQEDGGARSATRWGKRGRGGRGGKRSCPKYPLPLPDVAWVTRVSCSSTWRTRTWRLRGILVDGMAGKRWANSSRRWSSGGTWRRNSSQARTAGDGYVQ